MSQNFLFMKVNIVNINPKAVATFLLTKNICAIPMTSPRAAPGFNYPLKFKCTAKIKTYTYSHFEINWFKRKKSITAFDSKRQKKVTLCSASINTCRT